jgi:hypothetical protein
VRGFSVSGADMAIATAPGREAEEAVVYPRFGIWIRAIALTMK